MNGKAREAGIKRNPDNAQRRVILIYEAPARAQVLESTLRASGHQVVATLCGMRELAERIDALQPDIIVMDMEQPDLDLLDELRALTQDRPRPILLFAQHGDEHVIRQAIRIGVSSFVVDGWSSTRVKALVDVAIARFAENQALREALDEAKTTLAERKVVERAKGILMLRRKCDEQQAYGLLRKMAMDRNEKIVKVAHSVIGAAELLG